MPVDTKKVTGRRQVRYESFEDLLNDAEQLAAANPRTLGNWSQGQIYEHIASSLDGSIDGMDFSMPAPARWMMTLFLKRRFLHKGLPAGFKTGPRFIPDEVSAAQGLESLRKAIDRQRAESTRVMHPAFGNLGRDEWNTFHLRHAELHMSFLVPDPNNQLDQNEPQA